MTSEKKKKYKIGIVIGRFQPFHLGHKYLIEKAIKQCDQIIIGIGSSNITDDKNPFLINKRIKMVEEFVSHEKLEGKIKKIVSIEDDPDDDVWLEKLLKKTGKIDVCIGDNDWVSGIFENAKIPVIRPGHYKRDILEGTKIRKLMNEKKEWEDRVPTYLVQMLNRK